MGGMAGLLPVWEGNAMEETLACCFTGHRPARLPWGEQENDPRCLAMKLQISRALERAWGAGCRHFICGMARGCDLYFAEAVLALRQRRPEAILEAARPYEGQADGWLPQEQKRYRAILEQCNFETVVQHRYDRGCMMRRNRYMVDRSVRLIAVYDGAPKGGTFNTLAYAMRQGLKIDILEVSP